MINICSFTLGQHCKRIQLSVLSNCELFLILIFDRDEKDRVVRSKVACYVPEPVCEYKNVINVGDKGHRLDGLGIFGKLLCVFDADDHIADVVKTVVDRIGNNVFLAVGNILGRKADIGLSEKITAFLYGKCSVALCNPL